jgi:hypothetical protein
LRRRIKRLVSRFDDRANWSGEWEKKKHNKQKRAAAGAPSLSLPSQYNIRLILFVTIKTKGGEAQLDNRKNKYKKKKSLMFPVALYTTWTTNLCSSSPGVGIIRRSYKPITESKNKNGSHQTK